MIENLVDYQISNQSSLFNGSCAQRRSRRDSSVGHDKLMTNWKVSVKRQ